MTDIETPRRVRHVLALDLATKTGWSLFGHDGHEDSGVLDFSVKRDESDTMRMLNLRQWLGEKIASIPGFADNGLICWERVDFTKYRLAYRVHVQLSSTVAMWCEDNDIPYVAIPVKEIKQHATGKGNANKQQMVDGARRNWPLTKIVDDNQADALWLGDLSSRRYITPGDK